MDSRQPATPPTRRADGRPANGPHENVVQRLRRRTEDARRLGLEVRMEYLDGQAATWCQIGERRIVFIDLSQSATEQLEQLNETLISYQQARRTAAGERAA